MKYLLLSCLLPLFTGISSPSGRPGLACRLSTENPTIHRGEVPKLNVAIENRTDSEIYLIGAIDGSEEQWRMPYCYFTIEKPQPDSVEPVYGCGNLNPLRSIEIVKVLPGETFNPYAKIDLFGFWDSFEINRPEHFRQPGKYRIQFHYSTRSRNDRAFLGTSAGDDTAQIAELLHLVPRVGLLSNAIEITVVP